MSIVAIKNFFSEVFKHHTEDDAEQIVIVGAIGTIPDPKTLTSECPRPWLYTRVFMFFLLVTALLFVANMLTNPLQFSNVMVIGAFAVPFTTLTLLFEFNVFRNVSFYTVLKALFIGGAMSLIVTSALPSFRFQGMSGVSDAFIAGIGEEVAKMLVVYWILKRNRAYPYILNGLLIGAAVGAGFSIFETAGYAMGGLFGGSGNNEWLGHDTMSILLLRNVLAPGGHVVWAAMSGAGMLLAMRREPLSPAVFGRWRFWLSFSVPVVLHVLWDMPLLWKPATFDSDWSGIGSCLILTVVAWGVISWFLWSGLKEVDMPRAVIPWHGMSEIPPKPAEAGRRWAARCFDISLGVIVTWPVLTKCLAYFGVDGAFEKYNDAIGGIIAIPISLVLEAVVFDLFGTTFGKWAFSICVRDSNGRPAASMKYLRRLLRLWGSGLGFGLPIVSLIAPWIQYRKVRSGFNATYDESLGLRVDKEHFHPLRWIVVLPVLIVVVGLPIVGMFVVDDDNTAPESSVHADERLERLVSSAGLKCEWTEKGTCIIRFEMTGEPKRMQTCLAFVETVDSNKERLFACSMVAKYGTVDRSVIDEIIAANATMEYRQWCKLGDNLALRILLPMNVSHQVFHETVTQLAEDADDIEKRLGGNDEF